MVRPLKPRPGPQRSRPEKRSGATRRTALGLILGAPLLGACGSASQFSGPFGSAAPGASVRGERGGLWGRLGRRADRSGRDRRASELQLLTERHRMDRMLTRPMHHIRQNLVAYLALFVALGGTGYATLALPAGSVGNRQIRNHSITAVKLEPRSIAGSIKAWANVQLTNHRIAAVASSTPVRIITLNDGESIFWTRPRFSAHCVPVVRPQVTTGDGPTG